MTGGILDLLRARQELPNEPLPGDLTALEARYEGAARGATMNVGVAVAADSLRLQLGEGEPQAVPHLGEGIFGGFNTRVWFLDARGRRVGTPGAGDPVEMRYDGAAGHYVLRRQGR